MHILAFDTSFGAVSAALAVDDGRGGLRMIERFERRASGHAERLMPMIADVMEEAGVSFAALDRVAVTLGPGTFTGVRTGIAAARAFALAAGCAVVGRPTLEVMALQAAADVPGAAGLVVAVDARRGQIYLQTFAGDGERNAGAAELLDVEAAAARVAGLGAGGGALVGSGARLVRDAMPDVIAQRWDARLPELEPSAAPLARIAPQLTPLSTVTPCYIRAPDAKPQGDKSLPRRP